MQKGPVGAARFALYWAPELDDPLHAAGSAWLGRDAETGAPVPQPGVPGIAAITAEPRRYGLHATLKPPFRLACSYAELLDAARALAARTAPFALPPLEVADLDGFLALREKVPCPALQALADAAVTTLDACRAPPDPAELAKRRAARLTPAQDALLVRWGYPYVFEEWRFHVTLTRRLQPDEAVTIRPAAEAALAVGAAWPRRMRAVALFSQLAPDTPFVIAERLALGGKRVPDQAAVVRSNV